jgi:rod shape-determining protein MreC
LNENSEKRNRAFVVLGFLLFIQIVLISLQLPLGDESNYFEKTVSAVTTPLKHGVFALSRSFGSFWDHYFSFRFRTREFDRMNDQVLMLKQENLFLKNQLRKFESEQEIRESLLQLYPNLLIVRVIGLDLNNSFRSLIIDKGTLDGIRKDMIVLDKNGSLVGRILRPLSFKESRVQLITDTEWGIGVSTEKSDTFGILSGDGEGGCELKYILNTAEDIEIGQKIVTSGLDEVFPKNIPVGRITLVEPTDLLHRRIKVLPFFRFRDIGRLVVITNDLKEYY